MKKVKAKRPITHQGKNYKPGDVLETTDEHAQELIKQGHAEEETTIGSQHPPSGSAHPSGGGQGGPSSGKPPGGSGGSGDK